MNHIHMKWQKKQMKEANKLKATENYNQLQGLYDDKKEV